MPWSPSQSGNMNPRNFFAGLTLVDPLGGTNSGVFIPFSNLESYKAANSGDIRELTYSILDKVASGISALSTANRPAKFTVIKNVSAGETTAQKTFSIVFNLNAANTVYDVQDE
jgi:hypothetical protein